MPLIVIARRLFLIGLLALPQYFWLGAGWRLARTPHVRRLWRHVVRTAIIMLVAAMVLVLYDRISTRILPPFLSVRFAPVVQLWIFSSTIAFYIMLPFRVVDWCWRRFRQAFPSAQPAPPQDPSRRSLLIHAASVLGAVPFAGALYGYSTERLRFEVVPVDVPIANLPSALEGLRIVQLSDIHVGDFMPLHEVARAVAMANELSAHMAVITGDFLTSAGDPLNACIVELSRLRASLGVFGCNGNHEIYAGAESEAELLFRRHGMRLLRQSAQQITWNGAPLNMIGVDYQRQVRITGRLLPPLPIDSLVRRDMPNLLLSHNPNTFGHAAELGIELSLAGHTHGGQVNIEILHKSLNPARFMTDFIAGLYRLPSPVLRSSPQALSSQACLYVNRGLGTLGFPARIGARPEITLLTLRPAHS